MPTARTAARLTHRLRLHHAGSPRSQHTSGAAARRQHAGVWARLLRILVVTALMGLSFAFGPVPTASADGFECKEVPSPQSPNATPQAVFDSGSANAPTGNVFDDTGYGTQGWAGLKWYTYDLGCGEDITGVSLVRSKTDIGNEFLTIGESIAAAAFWLDDQANTPAQGEQTGRDGAIGQFDSIVYAVSDALRPAVFGPWLGIGIGVAGLIVLYRGLKSDAAGVTKQLAVGAAALALGGLMVGAPQKAISVADETFMSLITNTQGQVFDAAGIEKDPRLVITDNILIPDLTKGWFGSNAAKQTTDQMWPKLRTSLAYTYDEQQRIQADNTAQKDIDEAKKKQFQDDVVAPLEDNGLSYYTFQGKDSSRVSIGILAMVKTSLPSLLWIGASVLKISALLAIRLAVLGAPVWVPMVVVSGSLLTRVFRILGGIYLWALAAAVIMATYLLVLVKLYSGTTAVDGTWRLWFLIILTAVCWSVLRPFKRLSQTVTQNSHGAIGGALQRHRGGSWKKNLLTAGSMLANPAMGIAEKAFETGRKGHQGASKRFGSQWDSLINPDIAHVRQEGMAMIEARKDNYRTRALEARVAARGDRERTAAANVDLRKTPVDDTAGTRLPGVDLGNGGGSDRDLSGLRESSYGGRTFTAGYDHITVDDTDVYLSPPDPDRWDGGNGAVIAPVTVYRPDTDKGETGRVRPLITLTRLPRTGRNGSGTAVLDRTHLDRAHLGQAHLGHESGDRPPRR